MNPANIMRALADETRLLMLVLLRRRGELCVCDLENTLEITQSKASRHLRYLLNAGLLRERRATIWVYYRVAEDLNPAVTNILENIEQLVEQDKLQDLNRKLAEWCVRKQCGVTREVSGERIAKAEQIP